MPENSAEDDVIFPALFALLLFAGTVGNLLICYVVCTHKPMRTPMNYLLLNLAISDIVLLMFFSPNFVFGAYFTHPGGKLGDILCASVTGESLAWTGGYASAFSLTIIAIERYYAVVKPTHAKKAFTMRRLKLFVLFCWLLALSWNSVGFAVKRFDQVNMNCFMLWPDTVSFKIYSTMSLVVFGLVPGLLMCGLYSKIIYVLWINKLRHNLTCLTTERRFKLHRKKATKMAIVVSLVYLVSWIPELTVFNLIAYKPWLIRDIVTTYQVTVAMVMINSAVNPVIYTLHGQRYRHYLKKLLICLRKKPKQTRDEDTKL